MKLEEHNQTQRRLNIWMPLMLAVMTILGMIIGMKMQPTPTKVAVSGMEKPLPKTALGQGKIEELKYLFESSKFVFKCGEFDNHPIYYSIKKKHQKIKLKQNNQV